MHLYTCYSHFHMHIYVYVTLIIRKCIIIFICKCLHVRCIVMFNRNLTTLQFIMMQDRALSIMNITSYNCVIE